MTSDHGERDDPDLGIATRETPAWPMWANATVFVIVIVAVLAVTIRAAR